MNVCPQASGLRRGRLGDRPESSRQRRQRKAHRHSPFNDSMLRSCLYPRKALPKRMRLCYLSLIGLLASGLSMAADSNPPIDRHALVTRHDIDWPSLNGQIPLGNGNFAFNADGTGLETVGGNIMCHWCWHSFPLPSGVTKSEIRPWATPDHGRMTTTTSPDPGPIARWERDNPQP